MYGAIIGDICGSIYEWNNRKTDRPEEIELINPNCFFTDDTVLTCAIADAILSRRSYEEIVYEWANKYSDDKYPQVGYGCSFRNWFHSENPQPYNSWGNGSAMRVSAVGWAFDSLKATLTHAELAAEFTHNHPEGIKGAQAVAAAIYMARCRHAYDKRNDSAWYRDESTHIYPKEYIKQFIEREFGYHLDRTLDEIRHGYEFNESCQGSVPEAIIAFLESRDFMHAIQLAISIGGDSDTIACITGSIAEAYYREIPAELIKFAHEKVTDEMRNLLTKFCHKFSQSDRPAFPDYYVQIENEKKLQDEETWQRLRHQMKIENQKKIQQEWEQSKEKWEQSKEEWLKQKSLTYQQMFKRLKKLYEEFEERRFNSHTVSCYTYSPPCKFLDRYQLKDFFQKGLYYLQVIDSPATSEVLPLLKKYKRTLETLQYYGLNLSLKTIQLKEGDLFYLTIKFCINNIVCETREVPLPHLKYLNAMKELFRIGMFNGYTFDERKISGSEKRETANNWNLVREFFSTISNDNISRMFSNLDEFLGQ